jgi:hypothetical protein
MDIESLAKELILKNMTPEQQDAVLESVKASVAQAKEVQKQRIGENVGIVVQALKKIEADIQSRYDLVGNTLEKRVASIKDGKDGKDGRDGKNGKDGRDGKQGVQGVKGENGRDGRDGVDGVDGIGVSFARIDFDGSLVIGLSSGVELNVGEVVAPDLAERIKVITNGGGTSQSVLDTLASLQTQITNLIPSQTGNSGKYLTTNGTALSWASVAGGLSYQGTWNASTNTPTLTSSVGVNGYYYIVSTAGSTNLNGITDWQIGDWLLFNGSVWQKIDQSNLVTSVNGQTGAVSVGTVTSVAATAGTGITVTGSPITASGTLTITNSAPDQTVSLTASTGISTSGTYPNFTITNSAPDQTVSLTASTGISTSGTYPNFTITNSAPDQTVALTQGGTTTITGTYPNFTISSADQFQGTVTSVTGTSPVVSSGGATPAISLATAYGDTLNPYASKTSNFVLATPNGSAGVPTFRAVVAADIPTLNQNTTGTASNITASSNSTLTTLSALSLPGSQVSGNISGNAANVTGTVAVANGGTGQTTADAAFNALAPSQTSNSGKYLTTDGTNTSWASVSSGSGTVTSVAATVPSFLSISGSPITTSGTLAISYSGTALPVTNGGTGQTTASAAFNALSPITLTGDLIIGNGTNSATRLGIGTNGYVLTSNGTTATWSASSGGGGNPSVTTKITTYTITTSDSTVLCDATSAAFNVTLPTAVSVSGKTYVVKKIDSSANAITIATTSSQTIDTIATQTLGIQNAWLVMQSDGSNWQIIG